MGDFAGFSKIRDTAAVEPDSSHRHLDPERSESSERPSSQPQPRRTRSVKFENENRPGTSSTENRPGTGSTGSRPGTGSSAVTLLPDVKEDNVIVETQERTEMFNSGDNVYKRIIQIQGTVMEAKNLPPTNKWGKANPFCVVKGIKSNNNLVHIKRTRCHEYTLYPQFNENFSFKVPSSFGLNQVVGLKFFIFDGEEGRGHDLGRDVFLGGVDLDLYDAPNNETVSHQLELSGDNVDSRDKSSKSLLSVKIRIKTEMCERPPPLDVRLMRSLRSVLQITSIECKIVKATGLPIANMWGGSDAICVIRLVRLSGRYQDVHETKVGRNRRKPNQPDWMDTFYCTFGSDEEDPDEPVMLLFDIWDHDGGNDATSGEHLGSCMLLLAEIERSVETTKRLDLHGESQLLERMLNKDGKAGLSSNVKATDIAQWSSPTNRSGSGGKGLLAGLKNMAFSKNSRRSTLELRIMVDRELRPMPFLRFNDRIPQKPPGKPLVIQEQEDVKEAYLLPDWKFCCWSPHRQLERDFRSGQRPSLATLSSREKIIFIAGVVRGASGLPNSDRYGKSDPYCIVEGMTAVGEKVFIHRTRVIQNRLTPIWMESFFLPVPKDIDVIRLAFSVWDSDEAAQGGGFNLTGHEDELLGRTGVDLAYLATGEVLSEDIPLSGVKAGATTAKTNRSGTGFRRSPRIYVDVRVERRLAPVYEVRRDQLKWTPVPKHTVSYQPPISRVYNDPSQKAIPKEPHEAIARTVLELYESEQLINKKTHRGKKPRFKAWFKPQQSGWRPGKDEQGEEEETEGHVPPEEMVEQLDPSKEEREKGALEPAAEQANTLRNLSDVSRTGINTEKRAASLPNILTRFGHKSGSAARQFASMRSTWGDNVQLHDNTTSETLTHAMRSKTPLRELFRGDPMAKTI